MPNIDVKYYSRSHHDKFPPTQQLHYRKPNARVTPPPSPPSTPIHTYCILYTAFHAPPPVVNPYNNAVEGSKSPEAEAFVIVMQAAYGDWAAHEFVTRNGQEQKCCCCYCCCLKR
jgi:hypothetical protein